MSGPCRSSCSVWLLSSSLILYVTQKLGITSTLWLEWLRLQVISSRLSNKMNPKGLNELSIPGKVIRLPKRYNYGFGWNTVLKNQA